MLEHKTEQTSEGCAPACYPVDSVAPDLDGSCRAAVSRYRTSALRWLPVHRYVEKSPCTVDDAKIMARHLMRTGSGDAYEMGVRLLEAAGEPDLETIVPLHREAMGLHRATCLWNIAPSAGWSGMVVIARALRAGNRDANRLAERIERAIAARCL